MSVIFVLFSMATLIDLQLSLSLVDILQGIKDVSALHVDPVLKTLFIGTSQGSVHHMDVDTVFAPWDSSLRDAIKVSKNYIRMFRVNSDRTKLVVASKNADITVIPIDQLNSTTPAMIKLKGHSSAINWVDFSRNNPDLLISTSYDSTLRVWDISTGVKVATETAEEEPMVVASPKACYEFNVKLKFAIFSPLNEDCIIVGAHSLPLYVFNMTTKTNDFPPKIINCKLMENLK